MTYARDSAMTALILGFFASCWFGWAQERPPSVWKLPLIAAALLSVILAVIGGTYAWRHWSDGSALNAPGAMRQYSIIVGLEFVVAAVGAIALLVWGHPEFWLPGFVWRWGSISGLWRPCSRTRASSYSADC